MDAHIIALYDDETNAPMINDSINFVVEEIQRDIELSELSRHLKAIMNSWVRTHSWYNSDRMSKFEWCLRNVVSRTMRSQVLDLFKVRIKDYGPGRSIDEDDLKFKLREVSYRLTRFTSDYFWDLDTELTTEADRWVINNGERVIAIDFERPFSWFSSRTMSTHYHLPHVPKYPVNFVPLQVLACDFKHEPNWTCSICLEVDSIAVNSRCVRTACQHIFHMGCLDDCKRVFLQQKENYNKTCVPCPLCRAPIY